MTKSSFLFRFYSPKIYFNYSKSRGENGRSRENGSAISTDMKKINKKDLNNIITSSPKGNDAHLRTSIFK